MRCQISFLSVHISLHLRYTEHVAYVIQRASLTCSSVFARSRFIFAAALAFSLAGSPWFGRVASSNGSSSTVCFCRKKGWAHSVSYSVRYGGVRSQCEFRCTGSQLGEDFHFSVYIVFAPHTEYVCRASLTCIVISSASPSPPAAAPFSFTFVISPPTSTPPFVGVDTIKPLMFFRPAREYL